MHIERFFEEDLAQCSYAIVCESTGEVAIIDPLRDVDRYVDWATEHDWKITTVLETHVHADFLCGARELAAATGARILVSAEAPPRWTYQNLQLFASRRLRNGDELHLGNIRIRARHTPGHTPEHLSYCVLDRDGLDRFVFTGDFMFVDDLGRPDLLERAAHQRGAAVASANEMFDSVTQFLEDVPRETVFWPGHGAGSACGKSQSSIAVSSVGREARAAWWAQRIAEGSREAFVTELLEDQPEVPSYFARMKELNRDGMEILGGMPAPARLHAARVRRLVEDGSLLIDVAKSGRFRHGHLQGAVNLPLHRLSTYAGWLVEADEDVVLVCAHDQVETATRKLIRIGLDTISGWVPPTTDLPKNSIATVDVDETHRRWRDNQATILDVRGRSEFADGHIPGAVHIHYGQLRERLDQLDPSRPTIVHCASGTRATVAASWLRRAGFADVSVFPGGPGAWTDAGHRLE
jgi:hydroxyacylglutathione hydrolase